MGSKKEKRELPPGPKGAPEWVVTFTDMISLLVTFFVLLMTFSSLDNYDVMKVDAFLTGKGSIHKIKGYTIQESLREDQISASDIRRGASVPHVRPAEQLPDNIAEMGQKLTEKHLELNLTDVEDGLVLEFGTGESFLPGSAVLSAELQESLSEIGGVLENYSHMIVIEGFTDTAFQPSGRYATPEELSFVRASNAARILASKSGVHPELLQVAGLGSQRPRSDNSTAEGRRDNRRVQVRLLSPSKLRASHLEALQPPGMR